ncbi:MAG: 50S ribosome-binding GTPase [Gammaproteobacteria bacterium]|nr:50S ribosome-binding GTPase [Gammaproteobacteria bacterium]MBU2157519.1 50S ribosome-binding GTPase [Gammaproteobacteria bacterium]MBU2253369.1 50S ribosome-binding GTPase [Gammaproteobacteria bacterium]MBU2294471.1 50S ribosome-binding GTPase [Gammaproteobacteria bacterium]
MSELQIAVVTEESQRKQKILKEIREELHRIRSYTPKVGVFGDSGVGKSSLCNALFGRDVAAISDVEACTRQPQEILISNGDAGGLVLVDVPGVGEDPARHKEYVELYKSLVPNLDLVIWAIKADDRKYLSALEVYEEVLSPAVSSCPVLFVITQVDKTNPVRGWDVENHRPGVEQEQNIIKKINDISSRFNVSTNKIVPVAAEESYNLKEVVDKVVDVLPAEKRFSFTREAKEENVSEAAQQKAEEGVWDHIKEKFSGVIEYVKEDLLDTVADTVREYGPKVIAYAKVALVGWLAKRF